MKNWYVPEGRGDRCVGLTTLPPSCADCLEIWEAQTAQACTRIALPCFYINICKTEVRQTRWPRGLRCRSASARLLGLWFRIPPGAWMSLCCECCVLSGRGLCDELIPRPEKSYRLWCVVVCDVETS